jgi:glycosyltransferase involved in cell wall biosynthesis
MPFLLNACDIYAAPSRLEGFGMPQVEAGACGKPVLGLRAMGMLDTLVHEETALLAEVATEISICETLLGEESGFPEGHRVRFDKPRPADYRASVFDIAEHLERLLSDPRLRERLGAAGRERVVQRFDYRVVAQQFLNLLTSRLGLA